VRACRGEQLLALASTLVYTYTAGGLRVAQSVDGDMTSFSWDWDWATGIPEMLSAGDALYLVGHDTLGQYVGSAWAYYLPDALGSVRQTVNAAGAVVSVREWSPYGVELGSTQAGLLGYTGEWQDAGVGLLYLRARWYQPTTGRFTQRDVWREGNLRPQSLHLYVYVENNAVNLTDPTGRSPWALLIPLFACQDEDESICASTVTNLTQTDVECRGRGCSKKVACAFWIPDVIRSRFREECAVVQWVRGEATIDGNRVLCSGDDTCDPFTCEGNCKQAISSVGWHIDQEFGPDVEYPLYEDYELNFGEALENQGYRAPTVPSGQWALYLADAPALRGEPGQTIEVHAEFITAVYDRNDIAGLPPGGGMVGDPTNPSPHVAEEWRFDAGPYAVPECYSSLLSSFMVGLMAISALVPRAVQAIAGKRRIKRSLPESGGVAEH